MIDDTDRRDLADLAMRALDTITTDYGADADLIAASPPIAERRAGHAETDTSTRS